MHFLLPSHCRHSLLYSLYSLLYIFTAVYISTVYVHSKCHARNCDDDASVTRSSLVTYVATPKTLSILHSNGGCIPCMADPVVTPERFKQALHCAVVKGTLWGRPKHTTVAVGWGWGWGWRLLPSDVAPSAT